MKNFIELAKNRYSSRKYKQQEVEKEKLLQVLEAARIAPTAANKQPGHFIVINQPELLEKIYDCYAREWIRTAPAVIIACGDHNKVWRRADGKGHVDVDIAIAVDHMTLAATDIGLSTCWICMFDVQKVAKILGLPSNIEAVAMLPIGYPDDSTNPERHAERRKPIEEIVHWNEFEIEQ